MINLLACLSVSLNYNIMGIPKVILYSPLSLKFQPSQKRPTNISNILNILRNSDYMKTDFLQKL